MNCPVFTTLLDYFLNCSKDHFQHNFLSYLINSAQMTQMQKAKRRLKIIEEVVKEGKLVTQVCKAHKISRVIFYRWKARYDQSSPKERLKNLEDKKRVIKRHPRQVPKEYERLILGLVFNYPEFGVRRITQILPQNGENKSIVGHHGVQRVLERNNLNTFEKRLIFQSGFHFPLYGKEVNKTWP